MGLSKRWQNLRGQANHSTPLRKTGDCLALQAVPISAVEIGTPIEWYSTGKGGYTVARRVWSARVAPPLLIGQLRLSESCCRADFRPREASQKTAIGNRTIASPSTTTMVPAPTPKMWSMVSRIHRMSVGSALSLWCRSIRSALAIRYVNIPDRPQHRLTAPFFVLPAPTLSYQPPNRLTGPLRLTGESRYPRWGAEVGTPDMFNPHPTSNASPSSPHTALTRPK